MKSFDCAKSDFFSDIFILFVCFLLISWIHACFSVVNIALYIFFTVLRLGPRNTAKNRNRFCVCMCVFSFEQKSTEDAGRLFCLLQENKPVCDKSPVFEQNS